MKVNNLLRVVMTKLRQNVKNVCPLPPNVILVEHKEENKPQVDNSDGTGLPIQSLQRDSLDHGIMEVAVAG